MSVASRGILSNFFGEQGRQNHPQYLSGLSRALFPTTFLETAVSGMWRSVSSSDLVVKNMRRAAEYFWRTLRCFIRSSSNETLCGMLNITSQTNVILEGEIKDAKMSSFSSDFQRTLISFEFSIWIINEFENLNQGHEESSVVLRWLNTVLRAVSGNSRDGACFKLDKQTWRRKK